MSAVKGLGTPLASPPERATSALGSVETMTDAERVGRDFEAIFVRTLLRASPMGAGGDAYADMGVDALAKSITAGKGLGLADTIRAALEKADPKLGRKIRETPEERRTTAVPTDGERKD